MEHDQLDAATSLEKWSNSLFTLCLSPAWFCQPQAPFFGWCETAIGECFAPVHLPMLMEGGSESAPDVQPPAFLFPFLPASPARRAAGILCSGKSCPRRLCPASASLLRLGANWNEGSINFHCLSVRSGLPRRWLMTAFLNGSATSCLFGHPPFNRL